MSKGEVCQEKVVIIRYQSDKHLNKVITHICAMSYIACKLKNYGSLAYH